jgi:hypothetical protein
MTTIDKVLLQKLRTEMDAAMQAVAKANGVLIKTGSCSYRPASATFKVEVVAIGDDVENSDNLTNKDATTLKAASDWKARAILYGLDAAWLGQKAKTPQGEFEVVGLMPRRSKYPVLVKTASGLKLMTTDQIIAAFKK